MSAFQGTVSSTKNTQTATIVVRRRARHPLYGKAITKTKNYHVHDTLGVSVGDEVQFIPCKPISKTKKWTITKVVKNSLQKNVDKKVDQGVSAKPSSEKTKKQRKKI